MRHRKTFVAGCMAALAFGLLGCESDSGPGTALVNVTHLAWTIPAVDICIDGKVAVDGLEYGESSGSASVTAGQRTIEIAVDTGAGGEGGEGGVGGEGGEGGSGGSLGALNTKQTSGDCDPAVFSVTTTIPANADLTIAAYRTEGGVNPVNVFVFDNSTAGLATGSGRVSVGHGADAEALATVDVYTTTEPGAGGNGGGGGNGGNGGNGGALGALSAKVGHLDCNELINDFEFEQQFPADFPAATNPLDLEAGDVDLAVVVPADTGMCPADIALERVAPVTAGVKTNLVVVVEDAAEIYAIVGDANPLQLEAPAETE